MVAHLATGLRQRGYEVCVAGVEDVCAAEFAQRNIRVVGGGLGSLLTRGAAWRTLYRYLKKEQPDIVHSFETEVNIPVRFIAGWCGVPVRVSTVLTPWSLQLAGVSLKRKLKLTALQWLEKRSARLEHGAIAIAENIRQDYLKHGFGNSAPQTIFHTVPIPTICPVNLVETFGIPPGVFCFVAAGRLTDRKGVGDLIRVAARLKAAGVPGHILHVGDDPSGGTNRARYEQLMQELDVADRITLHGRWDGEIINVMAGADAVLMPSYAEGLGLTLIEAMIAGIPSVAYAVGGTVDVVDDGQTGFLVPLGNIIRLSEAAHNIIRMSTAEKEALAARAKQRYQQIFGYDLFVNAHHELYHRLKGK